MNRQQKHVTTLITITLLLLVILVGIAVVKGTFDIQAWITPTKRAGVGSEVIMSTQTQNTLQQVLDLAAEGSEYSSNTQEIDIVDDFIGQFEAGRNEILDPTAWTTKGAIIASVGKMIHLTSNLASNYYKAFGIPAPTGAAPEPRYMPRGDDGMEVPMEDKNGDGQLGLDEYVYFLVDDIGKLLYIKQDLEENFPEDITFLEDLRDTVNGFITVGQDILQLTKEIRDEIATRCKSAKDDPICAVEVLPFPPQTEALIKEVIRIKNIIGGNVLEWSPEEMFMFTLMLNAYLAQQDEEGITNREKLTEEWEAFKEGGTPEESLYYYVLNFINILALMLEEDDPLRNNLFDLYSDLLYISGYLSKLQKDVKEMLVPLNPLLNYMTMPYQYHVLGAVGQIEISYIYPTLEPMSRLNSAVVNVLRPFENNRTIGSLVASIINYVENINGLIGNVESDIDLLTPRVNTYVTVVEEEVSRDYYQELMEALVAFEERIKEAIGERLGERKGEASKVAQEESPDEEEPILCEFATEPNDIVKACEDYASKVVAQDIKSMTSDYLRIWAQYITTARAVRSVLDRIKK